MKHLTMSIKNAQEVYYLANGTYAEDLSLLDIEVPVVEGGEWKKGGRRYETKDWACDINQRQTTCRTLQGSEIQFSLYHVHTDHPNRQQCGAQADSAIANKVCQGETGNSNIVWSGKSHGTILNVYDYN